MKKIGEYTAKGIITSNDYDTHKIQLFDGRFDTGYRITGFEIALSNRDDVTTFVASAKLMTDVEDHVNGRYWNWSRNEEIAWASCAWDANNGNVRRLDTVIDPDNMVIEDLYIAAICAVDLAKDVNYMIHMDKYDITDWQGALSMVRNKSQG